MSQYQQDLHSQDVQDLFYRSLDPSRIQQAVMGLESLPKIGQGRHFYSALLRAQPCDLALSVARQTFHMGHQLDRWCQAMRSLQSCSHPLIPPMELGESDGQVYYVTPYCRQPFAGDRRAVGLESLEAVLAAAGLEVDDYWQLRCFQNGQPLVIDWSDLRYVQSSGSRI